MNFVSPDRSRAVVFVFQSKDGQASPVRPQGLAPQKEYLIRELNPLPGRAKLPLEGKSIQGDALMRDGFIPSCVKETEACVVELQ
jgi:alpha-galactosidase